MRRTSGGATSVPTGRRALVVDDEPDIRELVREILEGEGLEVVEAGDGREGLRALHDERPDIVVLDVMMPYLDGWRTLERMRDISDLPIIMLSARALDWERARGLRAGADDYMVKPFSPIELSARVAALLRRVPERHDRSLDYVDDLIRIDFARREVNVAGGPVALTPLEFRMLLAFVNHRDEVLTRERLLELVWGSRTAVFPDQVKLYVGYLRRKIESRLAGRTTPIETVRGFGYRYSAPLPDSDLN